MVRPELEGIAVYMHLPWGMPCLFHQGQQDGSEYKYRAGMFDLSTIVKKEMGERFVKEFNKLTEGYLARFIGIQFLKRSR